jgi:hypothetical protein
MIIRAQLLTGLTVSRADINKIYRMIGPFGDWLVHGFALWGIPLQNWMIPFVARCRALLPGIVAPQPPPVM